MLAVNGGRRGKYNGLLFSFPSKVAVGLCKLWCLNILNTPNIKLTLTEGHKCSTFLAGLDFVATDCVITKAGIYWNIWSGNGLTKIGLTGSFPWNKCVWDCYIGYWLSPSLSQVSLLPPHCVLILLDVSLFVCKFSACLLICMSAFICLFSVQFICLFHSSACSIHLPVPSSASPFICLFNSSACSIHLPVPFTLPV